MEEVWATLQASSWAAAIRQSTFIYPVANVMHVIAVIAFFGVVATMDLRLLQVFRGPPAKELVARLRPVALILLAVIAFAGFILFSAEAVPLARNSAFQLKMAAIALALGNIGVNHMSLMRQGEAAPLVRASAGLSLALWLAVAALGRSIAYV